MNVTIYDNPSRGTSREGRDLLSNAEFEPTIITYLKPPLTGTRYREFGLGDTSLADAARVNAIIQHPVLIERPIIVLETGVILCHLPERVCEILQGRRAAANVESRNSRHSLKRGCKR